MNYEKQYTLLIERAKHRIDVLDYSEKHHIKPASMCRFSKRYGERDDYIWDIDADTNDNIIELSAREHYVAHLLLARIYGGAMWRTVDVFAANSDGQKRFTGAMYEIARRKSAKHISERMFEIRKERKGNWHKSEESKERHFSAISKAHKGKKRPQSFIDRIKVTNSEREYKDDTRIKIAQASSGFFGVYITPNGEFRSLAEAGRQNKCDPRSVKTRCNSNNFPEWSIREPIDLIEA
ncbi:hypothetical protein NVP1081O_051 [Vibrio phage 1.081.O._10N.286.52.C2]|nr:hypothetical protein NVP1081O_051 [Vibrio phage 1.081.O._10N.286.52.C2]